MAGSELARYEVPAVFVDDHARSALMLHHAPPSDSVDKGSHRYPSSLATF